MPEWDMQPLSMNRIAFISDNPTDRLVFEQVWTAHAAPVTCDYFETGFPGDLKIYSLVIARNSVLDGFSGPVIPLDNRRIRVGEMLDKIESVILRPLHDEIITRGAYRLDWAANTLFIHGSSCILTEREKEIVYTLLNAGEGGYSRDDLLGRIWGYRTDLETHTLETHIYRLRQKIESDPTDPRRLVTTDTGYALIE